MLELKNLCKSFGNFEAVKNVNLEIRDGELFSILGPSGSGKSTLLRMLGGFEYPTSGEILLEGRRIDTLAPDKRPFNMVFQRYALFPHLNVERNVAFGLEVKGVDAREIAARVTSALELVQMNEFASRRIDTLSGGQQQRIALARALVNQPKLLLLDEPLSALDLKLRQQMKVELLALQRRLQQTFIFVTHDQEEALTMSDRVAVMNEGRVEQVGTPLEIYEYPQTPFVAQFIGTMNTFDGEVLSRGDSTIVVTGPGRSPLMVRASSEGPRSFPDVDPTDRVQLMVRPERLRLLKSNVDNDENSLRVVVREIMYQGPMTQYLVEVQSPHRELRPQQLQIVQPNKGEVQRQKFTVGEKAYVAWKPDECFVMEVRSVEQSSTDPIVLTPPLNAIGATA